MTDLPARRARTHRPSRGTSQRPLLDAIEDDPQLAVELAAAELPIQMHALLHCALDARPDLSRRDIAARLRVTEGRVSQILNGEDDLRASTFARYFRALGYRLITRLVPTDPDAPQIQVANRAKREYHDVYVSYAAGHDGADAAYTFVRAGYEIDESRGRVRLGTGQVAIELHGWSGEWTARLSAQEKALDA
ncbi:hypothetical protein ACFPER_08525 [Agromyces aurantiacus]|uniref:XRE family transcriptional regulator n=1 Tax=Agromyces aurantiacus TaxID=165814 RepID=A0ABV9R3X1_9MICO|nr:helix-turn-helix transcriptional regulator [Agromyces aurantiacus]MBM7503513.1 transcriptional regulator with XRE-family HTH domain [Agromyces aurantiacus]